MAWTSGFFHSVDGDRAYSAEQLSNMVEGLISYGVFENVLNKLAVEPNNGMTIQINSGRGYFAGKWVNNDSPYLITLEDADVTLDRYAAIGVRVNLQDNVREAVPFVKYGTASDTPVKPNPGRVALVKEYILAYVLIKAGATSITAADIEDTRMNSTLCGWVTGLINQVDTKTLWTQWQAQFGDFMTGKESEFTTWFNSLQDYLDENVEANIVSDLTLVKQMVKSSSGTFAGLGWDSQGDGSYIQTVSVTGVSASNHIMVTPKATYREIYNKMQCTPIEQGNGTITFKCWRPDDINLEFDVLIFTV